MWHFLADWLSYEILSLEAGTRLANSVNYFIYDSLKILFLVLLLTHLMSFIRYYLPVEKLRDYILKRRYFGLDYFLASAFGAITPFCSCSSIPLFMGFVGAGIPLGVTFSFLITSPLINEVAVALFIGLFGWKVTIIYVSSGILVGVIGGYVIEKMHMERYVDELLLSSKTRSTSEQKDVSVWAVMQEVSKEALELFKKVAIFILIGVGIGALMHGYVPEDFFKNYLSTDNLLGVPMAVLLAIPLYADVHSVAPILQALVNKGVPLGTALAFMMATVGLSLPEALILKKVIKLPLLITFFSVVAVGIIIIGYSINFISP
jgi:uncharacterized protein